MLLIEYKHPIPPGCLLMKGIGLFLIGNGMMFDHEFVGGSGGARFWTGIIGLQSSCGDTKTIEYIGKRSPDEAYPPKCGTKGTIELYEKDTELHRGFHSHTCVTTEMPMVNCMNVQCSHLCSLRLHERGAERRE